MDKIIVKPISELRTNLSEVSKIIEETDTPIILTKNGYDKMVLMSSSKYNSMLNESEIYIKMKEAELAAKYDSKRLKKAEVLDSVKEMVMEW